MKIQGRMLSFQKLTFDTDTQGVIDQLKMLDAKDVPCLLEFDQNVSLENVLQVAHETGLMIIGVVAGNNDDEARDLHLPILPKTGKLPRATRHIPLADNALLEPNNTLPTQAVKTSGAPYSPGRIHSTMVRSGQSIHHDGGDLTILGSVNDGAEAIALGNLHIYGNASGRIVAGATGDKSAHIFVQKLSPSLVSVAGTYCLKEDISPEFLDQAVMIFVGEDNLLTFKKLPS